MKNIANLSELLEVENNIECRRKAPVLGIIVALAGAAFTIYSFSIKELADRSTLFLSIGFIILVVGVCITLRKRYDLIYKPTGEKVSCKKMLFENKEKTRLQNCISKGETDELQKFSTVQSSSLMTVLYSTPSGSCRIAQIQEYVPHQYEPATEPYVYHKQVI